MDWEFQPRQTAGDGDSSSNSRIIIEGDHTISPFEVFVREVLQNSLDAADQGKSVTVCFKLHSITTPGTRDNFLSAFGWSKLKERVTAANRIRNAREEPAEFGDPKELESRAIQVMEISESGTIGLVGPEAIKNESDEKRWPGDLRHPVAAVPSACRGKDDSLEYHLVPLVPTAGEISGVYAPEDFVIRSEQFGVPQARHRLISWSLQSRDSRTYC